MTLQEVWSLLNLYNSSFSGEQIDEAIGVILNGGISAAVDAAQASAEAAAKSASEAAGSEANVGAAATNAQNAASRAAGSATEAESYAHGGTGKREGEDTDNARYYAALTEAFVAALNAAAIDGRGHLVFIAPDGSTRDLGDVTGEDGSSIQSITRTAGNGAPGTTDTYTVTLTDGSKTQFQVYNGKDGLGTGDMTAAVYDPKGKAQDVFKYVDDAVKGKLSQADLQEATDAALAQAKESGEFDGAAGDDGKSAFKSAVDGGYTGTEEEFNKDLAAVGEKAEVSKVVDITMAAASWSELDIGYKQTVVVTGGNANTLVSLEPTPVQIVALQDAGVTALMVNNDDGTFEAYAIGEKPTADMTVQAKLEEVVQT